VSVLESSPLEFTEDVYLPEPAEAAPCVACIDRHAQVVRDHVVHEATLDSRDRRERVWLVTMS
jgi:hypothetical protein